MRKILIALPLVVALGFSVSVSSSQDAAQELPPGMELMPEDKGREETYYACAACHSIRLVVQQGMKRKDWDYLLDWMAEEQDMEPLDAETETLVLDYLAKHYNTDRPNMPKPIDG